MTDREPHIPDGVQPPGGAALPARPDAGAAVLWEEWYRQASPAQRQSALALAAAQGVVYAPQLPAPAQPSLAPRSPLTTLLNGQVGDLAPLRPLPVAVDDAALDAHQRNTVARAVHTPDVFLIQGLPGTGKSRVLAEVVAQASARGERVLLLAATPTALDRVLQRLGSRPATCPVRCLGPDESPASLPACVRRLCLPERVRFFHEQTLPAARHAAEEARALCAARRGEESAWNGFAEMLAAQDRLTDRLRSVQDRRAAVPAAVAAALTAPDAASAGWQAGWSACVRRRDETLARADARLAEVRAEAEKVQTERDAVLAELESLRPLAEAREGHRWWTGAWWRAAIKGNIEVRVGELAQRERDLETAAAALDQEAGTLTAQRREAEDQLEEERRRLTGTESARQLAELDSEAAALEAEGRALDERWQKACAELLPGTPAPDARTHEAVRAGRATWAQRLEQDERRVRFAAEWAAAAADVLPTLPDRLAELANVVAATTTALAGNPYFGDRAGISAPFDLLIVDEAHALTESEFQAAARRARRWVLVGEPADGESPPAVRTAHRPTRAPVLRTGFFRRLWHHLHGDPARLSYAWFPRDGRLVCRLRPVPPGQEQWVETEGLADRSDVELRILTVPRHTPELVEVTFPAALPIAEAKQIVCHEVGEVAVQPCGPGWHWEETDDLLVCDLGGVPGSGDVTVPLAEGVCEVVGHRPGERPEGASWRTRCLRFERSAGWSRERAEGWVEEKLGLRSLGRTALLAVPYRARPPLAGFLSDLLFEGAYRCPPVSAAAAGPVEFVPVPALEPRPEPRRHSEPEGWGRGGTATVAPRLRAVKGGAGLEVDLAESRPLEPLPADLRATLPAEGLVNYLEAEAVVRRLESLLADPVFRAEAEEWQRSQAVGCAPRAADDGCTAGPDACLLHHAPAVAVLALYPAQAELIRLLMARSATLAHGPVRIEVGTPATFQQRECLAALVSLTRSHSHRAVSFGEGPQALALALTRPAGRLILFGDPGTLARRSQWQGAVDHLDEATAGRERSLAAQLVQYLQGHGLHPGAFRLLEGANV